MIYRGYSNVFVEYGLYMKYLYASGMSYDVFTKMIESVVEPVLFCCSGIWGTRKFPKVQSVFNKACRYFLVVSRNAPNTATRGDMGWVSAEVKQKLECTRLWCRLKNMTRKQNSTQDSPMVSLRTPLLRKDYVKIYRTIRH